MLHAVILAGGSGTRFWPESRKTRPKQFLCLAGEQTLLQQAAERCTPWVPADRIWIATGAAYVAETQRQLPQLPASRILAEPCGRNTAACIGLAAIALLHEDPQATMLVMPADHVIQPASAFNTAVLNAVQLVEKNPQASVLFGIRPNNPATGFGYIEQGNTFPGIPGAFKVKKFREKPTRQVAQEFLDAGTYFWNSGIFVWRASQILDMLAEFQPDISSRLKKLSATLGTPAWNDALSQEFPAMPSISIDYGVLERAQEVFVLEAPFEWDDVGSWHALARLWSHDADGNTVVGLHCGTETSGCIIQSTPDHLVATIGLEDCIVVHTPEATLVARKDDENALRRLVTLLQERGHGRFL